jgi:hypothetical protein
MKLLGRISIILAAALVVVGIAIGLSQTSYVQNMTPARNGFEQRQSISATANGATVQGGTGATTSSGQPFNPSGSSNDTSTGKGGRSGSLFAIAQVGMNFSMISIIVMPFAIVPRILRARKGNPPGGQQHPPLDEAT